MRVVLALLAAGLIALLFVDHQPEEARPAPVAEPQAAPPPEDAMLIGRSAEPADAEDEILSSPEMPSEEVEQVLPPPDPAELGECTLIVRLRGSPTGKEKQPYARIHNRVDLWRLDAPANEGWTRGDQLQAHVDLVEGVATFEKLPPGMYRIHAHGQRKGSADPEAFEVHGPETDVFFDVETPRSFPVHLRVVDEYGTEIRDATARHGSAGGSISQPGPPRWVTARKVTDPNVNTVIGLGGGGWGEFSRRRTYPLKWTEQGFVFGRFKEETRSRSRRDVRHLNWEGRTSVSVRITGKIRAATTYIGVSVPMESIHERVLLPDGRRAHEAGASITAHCDAQPITDEWGPRDYRDMLMRVSVSLAGYKDLKFKFSLNTDDWTKTLELKEKP